MKKLTGKYGVAAAALMFAAVGSGMVLRAQDVSALRRGFATPSNDAKPMMRWWWFGPAVTPEEITREIDQMHAGGIGGFELASVYPLALDDPAKGIHNLRYASPEMVEMLRVAQEHGRALGMRVDLTLGSGWPFGGPHISIDLAAANLKVIPLPLHAPRPLLVAGESLIAVYSATGTPQKWDGATAHRESLSFSGEGAPKASVAVYFILSHTKQMVKRASVGSEGYVLDHMSKQSIATHLAAVGEPLLKGFTGAPPYAIFSDSLEVYGSDWTPTLPQEFQRRRGYDLLDHLPELVQGGTPQAEAVRHDWGVTLSDLVRENYLQPMTTFAAEHGTKFRSQTYGEPAATLADERVPQLPEGEGPQWSAFSFTRWTSSANHIFGNNVTSAETWTWLHAPVFRATPLDMKAEADRMFLEGVNQLIGHGWPYSAPGVQEPGWSLYAAAVFNAHNPWWPVMPQVMGYLQRVSWLLRQGEPANDIAVLLPEDDAQAEFRPGHVSVTAEMQHHITPALMKSMLGAGYNIDYTDAKAIELKGLSYPVVVVPTTHRMPLALVQRLQTYAKGGGKIIFVGETPSTSPGLMDAGESARVAAAIAELLPISQHVASEAELPAALHRALLPDMDVSASHGEVGFLHRKLKDADVYFIANTSNAAQVLKVSPRSTRHAAEWWDAEKGGESAATLGAEITLPPYASRVLVLHDGTGVRTKAPSLAAESRTPITLTGWHASFPGSAGSPAMPERAVDSTVWTDDAATKFYSGEVRYTTTFTARALGKGQHLMLQFPDGKPLVNTRPPNLPGMRAWFDAPVRDAAVVTVNGKPAGTLWHPPYELDLSTELKDGDNTIEVRVFNTATNEMAVRPPVDYTALKGVYGDRFQMQDMDKIDAATSGMVGPVTLEYRSESK
jgi:hypothetical protein